MIDIKILRSEIDRINRRMVELLAKRMNVAGEIAEYKRANSLPMHAPEREKQVIENVKRLAKEKGLDEKIAEDIFLRIIEHTRNMEMKKNKNGK